MTQPSTKTRNLVTLSPSTSNTFFRMPDANHAEPQAPATKHVDSAVYAYIQARRALGETNLNTSEVARALRLPQRLVDASVKRLTGRGVKIW